MQLTVEPIAASTTLVNLRVRYRLVLANPTDRDFQVDSVAETVLAGRDAQEAAIRAWFTGAAPGPIAEALVPAQGTVRIEREIAVPLAQLGALNIGGRAVMIPVLMILLPYRDGDSSGQIAQAFVLGKPGRGDAKLAPLPLDQGMGGFGELAARDTGIVVVD